MGTVTDIGAARRRRAVSRFCTECRTPWALSAVRRRDELVILCRVCGHVRASIPAQRSTD